MSLIPLQPVSGQIISTSVSGNVVSISGTAAVSTSVSGNYVSIISGSVGGFSGLAVSTSISGNVVAISGTVTVAGSFSANVSGNTVLNVPAWYGATPVSGWFLKVSGPGFSGANTVGNYVFDYSGQQFIAWASTTSGQPIPFVSVASGIAAQVSGASVATSVSGNLVGTSVSGNAVSISGNVVAISGTVTVAGSFSANVSGNTVLNVPAWYGAVDVSGWFLKVSGPAFSGANTVGAYIFDYSGQQFVAWAGTTSGQGIPFVSVASGVGSQISGVAVSVSGNAVSTSVSGNVFSISGTATIAGAVTTNISGNTVLNVPAWYGAVDVSGWFIKVSGPAFSGANTVGNYIFDYSGQQFIAWASTTSGERIPFVSVASGIAAQVSGTSVLTNVSGNVVSISGSVTTITSVSGNTMKPQTPTYIKSNDITRFSVASGGTALTSIACVAATIRNVGNSGDVILVGSLSSPPYFGTSGQAWPAISGMGIWLRDGDGITLNTTDTANIKVTANLSGTPVSYIAVG